MIRCNIIYLSADGFNTPVIPTPCMCSCALLELCLAVLDVWETQRRQTWMSVACPATGGRHRAGRASGRKNRESPYILEQVAKVIVAMRMQGVGRTAGWRYLHLRCRERAHHGRDRRRETHLRDRQGSLLQPAPGGDGQP